MSAQSSLLEPAGGAPVTSSMAWINGVLFGQLAIGLCVIAVAFIGALMLTGRLPLRDGMRVVLGCFILLGAPAIAAGFLWLDNDRQPVPPPIQQAPSVREGLQPANADPLRGA